MRAVIILFTIFLFGGCKEKNNNPRNLREAWLDSIAKKADSSYSKDYYRTNFVKAYYYINSKDSTVTQVMKDSANRTRQVIVMKGSTRVFYAQYFANGNIQADLSLDAFGQYHGTGIFYHENGNVQSNGNFNHGLRTGEWKVFDDAGKLIATDKFDSAGQLIQPAHP